MLHKANNSSSLSSMGTDFSSVDTKPTRNLREAKAKHRRAWKLKQKEKARAMSRIKVEEPEPYNGSANFDKFEQWTFKVNNCSDSQGSLRNTESPI